jgi:hypothetical protein
MLDLKKVVEIISCFPSHHPTTSQKTADDWTRAQFACMKKTCNVYQE